MYLKARQVSIPSLDDPSKPAKLETDLRTFVNWEIFFFRDRRALKRFEKDPLKSCGLLTDPVSGLRFRPTQASPRFDYGGRPYFFSADSTFTMFRAMPDSFAVRRGM